MLPQVEFSSHHSSTYCSAVVCIFVRLGNLASQYFLKYFTVHHNSSDSNNAIHFETPQHILLYYQRAYVPNCSLYHQLPAPRCIICSLRLHQIQFSDLPQIINALSVLLRQLVSCPVLYTVLLYKPHLRTQILLFLTFGQVRAVRENFFNFANLESVFFHIFMGKTIFF